MREVLYSNPRSNRERKATEVAKKAAKKTAEPDAAPAPTMDQPGEPTLSAKEQQRSQRLDWEREISGRIADVKQAVCKAGIDELNAQEAFKDTKSTHKALTKELRSLEAMLADPKGHLPLTSNKPLKGQKGLPDPGPLGPDEHGSKVIGHLSSKDINRINPAAFETAKGREEPIGLTDKMIEAIAAKDIKTIADLEKFIATDEWWHKKIPGIGEKAVNRVIDTLVAFRAIYPIPAAPEVPQAEQKPDWEQAADELRAVLKTAGELAPELEAADKTDGATFVESVIVEASDMLKRVTEGQIVTPDQRKAITNWANGVAQWQQPA